MALERFIAKAALAAKLLRVTLARRFRARRSPATEVAALIVEYAADGVLPIAPQERERQYAAFACVQCSSFCERACPVLALPEGARFGGPAAAATRLSRAAIDLGCLRASLADCVGCGLCQAACPHGVPLGEIIRGAWALARISLQSPTASGCKPVGTAFSAPTVLDDAHGIASARLEPAALSRGLSHALVTKPGEKCGRAAGPPKEAPVIAIEAIAAVSLDDAASLNGPLALVISPQARGNRAGRALIARWRQARPDLLVLGAEGDRPAVSGLADLEQGDPTPQVRAALAGALIDRLRNRKARTVLCDDAQAAAHLAAHCQTGAALEFRSVRI